jgi:hypothetical protein
LRTWASSAPNGSEEVHEQPRNESQGGEGERHHVGLGLVEVLVALLDVERDRLRLGDDPARPHRHGAELAQTASEGEDDA